MNLQKNIGWLLISGALGVLIPYTALTLTFDYPDILREDTALIMTRFHEGGPALIATWFAFAVLGLPLLAAYVLMGQWLEKKHPAVRLATTLGVVSLIVQMIGLLRWTFVVPVLASAYSQAKNPATREAVSVAFQVVHQYGGVVLGEHLGQLFTIAWTVLVARALGDLRLIARPTVWLGYLASAIYLLAQAELFATVMPGFPVWEPAGLVGSTLWLVWLVIVGVRFTRRSPAAARADASFPAYRQ
ncbi:DUF4386 domain-containing protein [Tellurirhabdus rosea]|uniref:DUF4386 domain-containing protein n=1 Tax=Tellurirhabdus rosea TaxID=2674997 RepID=UPI0022505CA4|nr:DUF4386 domain-containing protein [Tellurirhabdus rosea]